jgi:hypothetical protein
MLSAFRCRSVALTCLISLLNLVGNGVAQESQHTYGEHGNAFQYEPEAAGAYYESLAVGGRLNTCSVTARDAST